MVHFKVVMLFFFAGDGSSAAGGDITFLTGAASFGRGGNFFLNAGSGSFLGSVVIGPNAQLLSITPPVVIDNSYLQLVNGFDEVLLQADPTSIFSHNGLTLLRSESDYDVIQVDTTPVTNSNQYERLVDLQHTLNAIINSLSQCQHGLFYTRTVDPNDPFSTVPRDCPEFTV
jgi:hypothetical protein